MISLRLMSPLPAALILVAAIVSLVPTPAEAADLQVTFTAPTALEATSGSPMTLKVKVKNLSASESSPAVRLSLYKYDHTCSGYPLTAPAPAYVTVDPLAPNAETPEDLLFSDANTSIQGGAASFTACYKAGLKTSSGGYYSDSNNANHTSSKAVKYVASATTTTTAPLAFTVSNLRVSPTSCGPGQHWVEATVNSTQPAQANVTLEAAGATASPTTATLQTGNNTVRANLTYPQAGTYNISFVVKKDSVLGTGTLTATIPKCKGTISITAPAAGEVVPAGGSYAVRWTSANVPKDDLLSISVWNGSQYVSIVTNTPNDGSESITMPNVSITNAKVQMHATKVIAPAFTRDFTLSSGPASITFIQPAGGESVAAGGNACLRWTSSGNTGNAVSISLYHGDQFLHRLATMTTNDGNECVAIPSDTPAMTNAKFEILTPDLRVKSNAFTITGGTNPSGFTVSAPAAAARLAAGSATTVTWTSSGNPGSTVTLKLSLNNGSYADIPGKTNIANDGSEEVILPGVYSWSGCTTTSSCPPAPATAANATGLTSTTPAKIKVVSTTTTTQGESGSFSITVPALRFSSTPGNFYNMIATRCSACHPNSGGGMINPQLARSSDDPASSVNETVAPVIPFNTDISGIEMLTRFKQAKAVSADYSRARDKKYVVSNDPSQSGLHWKAQDSSSGIFEEDLTIDGVKLKIQDWISLWIKQGGQ
jgi:hypothetical protein